MWLFGMRGRQHKATICELLFSWVRCVGLSCAGLGWVVLGPGNVCFGFLSASF